MRLRSSNRQQEERPESGRDQPWTKELRFHTIAMLMSLALYFGGTEYALRWIRWWQQQSPSTPTTCPAPRNTLSQQQLQHLLAVQKTIRKHQIKALVATIHHHPLPQKREEAKRILQGFGVVSLPPKTPQQELIAQSQ